MMSEIETNIKPGVFFSLVLSSGESVFQVGWEFIIWGKKREKTVDSGTLQNQSVSQGGHWPKKSLHPLKQAEYFLEAVVVCAAHGAEHWSCN